VPNDGFRRPAPMADLSAINAPGGTLLPDDPFFITSGADHEVREAARRLCETVVIKAPRQHGKSSLLGRYLAECARLGKRTVLIDLSLLSERDLVDYPTFLTSCAEELTDGLGLVPPPAPVTRQAEMNRLIREHVLAQISDNIVVAFDEADRVLGQPYQSDFFSMLRGWRNQGANPRKPVWARLELALAISTEPYLLIAEVNRSPFNVGATIELQPIDAAGCHELNRRYNGLLTSEQVETLRRDLLNGHPYLTRLAYYVLIQRAPIDFDAMIRDADRPDGPFGDHLRALTARLRRYAVRDLVHDLREAMVHGRLDDEDTYYRLHGAGLVRREGGRIVPANMLYARFFGNQA
jgi:hypothetical protein